MHGNTNLGGRETDKGRREEGAGKRRVERFEIL